MFDRIVPYHFNENLTDEEQNNILEELYKTIEISETIRNRISNEVLLGRIERYLEKKTDIILKGKKKKNVKPKKITTEIVI